jgi:hypothetical protein
MAKTKNKPKRTPKSVLKLPDLEQSKSVVLNSLTSPVHSEPTTMRSENSSSGIVQSRDCPLTRLWSPGIEYLSSKGATRQQP